MQWSQVLLVANGEDNDASPGGIARSQLTGQYPYTGHTLPPHTTWVGGGVGFEGPSGTPRLMEDDP